MADGGLIQMGRYDEELAKAIETGDYTGLNDLMKSKAKGEPKQDAAEEEGEQEA
jgi:hypothetical protein